MKITIAGQDYTAALDAARPLTIERKLNEPTLCLLRLSLPSNGSLAIPVRNASLAVTGDDGTSYFTGYIAVSPLPEYAVTRPLDSQSRILWQRRHRNISGKVTRSVITRHRDAPVAYGDCQASV